MKNNFDDIVDTSDIDKKRRKTENRILEEDQMVGQLKDNSTSPEK